MFLWYTTVFKHTVPAISTTFVERPRPRIEIEENSQHLGDWLSVGEMLFEEIKRIFGLDFFRFVSGLHSHPIKLGAIAKDCHFHSDQTPITAGQYVALKIHSRSHCSIGIQKYPSRSRHRNLGSTWTLSITKHRDTTRWSDQHHG